MTILLRFIMYEIFVLGGYLSETIYLSIAPEKKFEKPSDVNCDEIKIKSVFWKYMNKKVLGFYFREESFRGDIRGILMFITLLPLILTLILSTLVCIPIYLGVAIKVLIEIAKLILMYQEDTLLFLNIPTFMAISMINEDDEMPYIIEMVLKLFKGLIIIFLGSIAFLIIIIVSLILITIIVLVLLLVTWTIVTILNMPCIGCYLCLRTIAYCDEIILYEEEEGEIKKSSIVDITKRDVANITKGIGKGIDECFKHCDECMERCPEGEGR